jgi:hypothetical protein
MCSGMICASRTQKAAHMTLTQALHKIHQYWQALPHASKASHEAVWIRIPPTDELVEEEWVGIEGDGTVVWAYASGCASAHGPQETESDAEIKVLQCNRKDIPQPWQAAIIRFADAC